MQTEHLKYVDRYAWQNHQLMNNTGEKTGDVERVLAWKMQTEHLKYVDLIDLHHRFLVQISRQIARGFAWRPISLARWGPVTGSFF